MTRFTWFRSIPIAVVLIGGLAGSATAQIPSLKKIKDAAKKVVKAVDTTTKVADTVKAAPPPPAAQEPAAKPATGSAKIWENYDFVPGNKVLFFTDFSDDKVGNFARRLKYKSGPVEVVERDGVKVLRATGRTEFLIPVPKKLPERFTLEIDIIAPSDLGELITFEGGAEWNAGAKSASVVWMPSVAWITGGGQLSPASRSVIPAAMHPLLIGTVAHLRALMDGPYFKMYVNERRLYNIPELLFHRDSVIRIMINGGESEDRITYLTSIRVAESETDVLYDALAAKGRWATQGILFATGKAEIQPESRPVLKEIAGTLKEHADLKILIEGHTDNVGTPASNLTLSDARAAAVKAALVADFGIGADRVTTKGLGDTKPAVPNTTAEGRAQNRRVEVVKQ